MLHAFLNNCYCKKIFRRVFLKWKQVFLTGQLFFLFPTILFVQVPLINFESYPYCPPITGNECYSQCPIFYVKNLVILYGLNSFPQQIPKNRVLLQAEVEKIFLILSNLPFFCTRFKFCLILKQVQK